MSLWVGGQILTKNTQTLEKKMADNYSSLKRLKKSELLETAQQLAKKKKVQLIAKTKSELASFITYYQN